MIASATIHHPWTLPLSSKGPYPKCRLLYLVGQLRAGGLERQLFYLLQTMNRERYNPAVLVWNYTETDAYVQRLRSFGIPLYSFSGASPRRTKLQTFRQMIWKFRPEVVHSYSFYTNFAAHWATYGTKTVVLGSIRSDFFGDKRESGPWLGRLSARWPRNQICNSELALRLVLREKGPFVPSKLHVVRNGVDLNLFCCSPVETRSPPVILGVGSLIAVKRWDRLITVASKLKKAGHAFHVRIVGEGNLSGTLQHLVQGLDVDDQVHLVGHVDYMPREFSNATFVVHTSEVEGCPNVILEAMASGRAVVAMDSGDIAELVDHCKTGFVVPQGDDSGLAHYVGILLTRPWLSRSMGEAARQKANREFGVDRLLTETLAAYRANGWKDV